MVDAYRFICAHYEPGDELSLFGFSRGAFAVRAVLGVLASIGVLHRTDLALAPLAVALAQRPISDATLRDRMSLRRAHANDVAVRFVGVWDTVVMHGPLSRPGRFMLERMYGRRFGLSDQTIPRNVHRLCHALALDEQRAAFWPWRAQRDDTDHDRVQEVWFAGSHSDVGGGYAEPRPSQFALEWMVEQAAQAGLKFSGIPRPAPDAHSAPLNPSRTHAWQLLGARRRIVEPDDVLHRSVEQRMQVTGYVPAGPRR